MEGLNRIIIKRPRYDKNHAKVFFSRFGRKDFVPIHTYSTFDIKGIRFFNHIIKMTT
jgi:hypothetical protein